MRKIYTVILIGTLTLTLLGCQKQPEEIRDIRKDIENMIKKIKFVVMIVGIILTLSACAKDEINDKNEFSQTTMIREQERVINGYEYVDGREVPVQITMSISKILHGKDAYNELYKQNSNIEQPGTNEEYVVVTFNVSYDEGEAEELSLIENRASMEMAGLYFSLSNASSNTQDVTAYLTDNIYDISLEEGEETQGTVAFLQERENVQPLYFIGFENMIEFSVND